MPFEEKYLVTGGGGFIGGWLVETLYLSGLTNVRAGIHTWASAARLARFPVEIIPCDMMDREQIGRVLSGVTHVIHCAKGSRDVNVQGTRNLLEAGLKAGVRRFVYISTTEVYGNQTGTIDETRPCELTGHPYGDSKIEAEQICWEYSMKGLPVTVIRPPIVYGPFSKDWTARLAQKIQSGYWGIFKGYGDGKCNLIYVSDLVSGILRAARDDRGVGQVFNLSGPETVTWNQYFQRFNTVLGFPELRLIDPAAARMRTGVMEGIRSSAKFALAHFEIPLRNLSQRYGMARQLMRTTEKRIKSTPRPEDLGLFNRDAVYVAAKARELLGFRPTYDLNRGLDLSACWLEHLGLINHAR